MINKTDRIPVLDGLRAVAVSAVIVYHCFRPDFGLTPGGLPLSQIIKRFMQSGWMGVDLFFVLSGFLITGILLKVRGKERYWSNFWIARAKRILPAAVVYVGAIVLLAPMLPFPGPPIDKASTAWALGQSVNLQILFQGGDTVPRVLFHLWSLAVEQQFYLFWPFAVAFIAPKRLPLVAVVLCAVAPLIRTVCERYHISPYFQSFCRYDGFLAGALVAMIMAEIRAGRISEEVKALVGKLSFAVLVISGGALVALVGALPDAAKHDAFLVTAGFTVTSAFFASAMLWLLVEGPFSGWPIKAMSLSILRPIARVSFAMYLWHIPILFIAMAMIQKLGIGSTYVRFVILLSVVFAGAYVLGEASWHLVEKWALKIGKRKAPASVVAQPQSVT